tara:strand:+ start:20798 stop:21085 length:288 start_codon:yes stop_codon:yes gene_type:complete
MISLSACSTPQVRDLNQLNLRFKTEKDPVSGRIYIIEKESGCYSRKYEHSLSFIGKKSKTIKIPFNSCSNIIGYNPAEYIELYQFMESIRKSRGK